jgi:hypothetical protein
VAKLGIKSWVSRCPSAVAEGIASEDAAVQV